jgi:hypothetical protein
MDSKKLFVLLFCFFIFTLTFSSNYKKRKRRAENIILNPQNDNTEEVYSEIITFQPVTLKSHLPRSNTFLLKTKNVENFTIPFEVLNKLLEIPNVFRYIFPYLSLFELELNFKCISTSLYELYEKFLQEEKLF